MTLDDTIAALYVREINCGCETFWDGGTPAGRSTWQPVQVSRLLAD